MQDKNQAEKKKILLAEDNLEVRDFLTGLFLPYKDIMQVESATSAKKVYQLVFSDAGVPNHSFEAIILDIMMPYGSVKVKKIIGGVDDDQSKETGYLFLNYLRAQEALHHKKPVWVNVITTRNAPDTLHCINQALDKTGRIYIKPFNSFAMENDICTILGILSQVPDYLLPEDYTAPARKGENP